MGAIVDTLLLDLIDIRMVQDKYPDCVITKQTNHKSVIQKFQLVIPNEDEHRYYYFLVDNCIAMSSRNFVRMALNDPDFMIRMKERIARNRRLLGI